MHSGAQDKKRSERQRAAPRQPVRVPPPQKPVQLALRLAAEAIRSDPPSAKKLVALGAAATHEGIRLPVLNRFLLVNPESGDVSVENGGRAGDAWAVLALHYLSAQDVSLDEREVSLAHFPDCRGYVGPFSKRVIGRFLGTVGRSGEGFSLAGEQLGGTRVPGAGISYRFDVLPRVSITLILFEGDEEFGPNANVLFRADAEHLLPPGTIVAAAELLVGALVGRGLEEPAGGSG